MRRTSGHGIGVKSEVTSPPQLQMTDRDHFLVLDINLI
jgi:hypothetical protein